MTDKRRDLTHRTDSSGVLQYKMDDMFALGLPIQTTTPAPAAAGKAGRSSIAQQFRDLEAAAEKHVPTVKAADDSDLFRQILSRATEVSRTSAPIHKIDASRLQTKSLLQIKKQRLEKKASRNTVPKATQATLALASSRKKASMSSR